MQVSELFESVRSGVRCGCPPVARGACGRPRALRRARGVGVVLLALLTRLHLVLALLTGAGLTLAGTAAPASAALPSGNLLQNPGAEAGPGAATAADTVAPPSWLTTPNFTAVQYTPPRSPDATGGAPIGGGGRTISPARQNPPSPRP